MKRPPFVTPGYVAGERTYERGRAGASIAVGGLLVGIVGATFVLTAGGPASGILPGLVIVLAGSGVVVALGLWWRRSA